MKSIKRIIIISLGIFIFSATLHAQRGSEQHAERLKTELELSDEQWEQLQPILEEKQEKMRALRDQEFDSREERKAAFQEIQSSTDAALVDILTAEQIAKLGTMKKQRQAKMQKMKKTRLSSVEKQAMKQELEAYKTENITPVLAKERAELDKQISAEDKEEIDRLRVVMKEKKKTHKAKAKAMRESGQHLTKEERIAYKEKMKNDPDIQSLNALVEKYEEPLTEIHDKLAPQREQWKSDMKTISKKHMDMAADDAEGNSSHARRHRDRRQAKAEKKERLGHGKFLLMNPAQENGAKNKRKKGNSAVGKFKVYPNPASTNSTVEYTLKKDSYIKLSLRDKEGNTIRVLEEGDFAQGDHNFQVPVGDLENGIYYFSIEDESGKIKSKKIAVNN